MNIALQHQLRATRTDFCRECGKECPVLEIGRGWLCDECKEIGMSRKIDTSESQVEVEKVMALVERAPLATVPATPESMLQSAIDAKMDPASMEKFYDLFERMKKDQAKAAHAEAMAKFKAICPAIPRRSENPQFKQVNRNGVSGVRMFASLEDIGRVIQKPLSECGLSFRFGEAKVEGGYLSMPCIIAHAAGHSESSSIPMPVESKAGCSDQQKFGIAQTYAMRYSLVAALGLTTCDQDDDGNMPDSSETITAEQAANLDAAVAGVGGDSAKFLAMLGVAKYADIPLSKYGQALAAIEKKRKGGK